MRGLRYAGLFAGVTNCPVATIFMGFELFGFEGMKYFALAVSVSFALSGYYGLYSSQKFTYSKTRTEFINRKPISLLQQRASGRLDITLESPLFF